MECEGHMRAAKLGPVISLPYRQADAPPTLNTLVQQSDKNRHENSLKQSLSSALPCFERAGDLWQNADLYHPVKIKVLQ